MHNLVHILNINALFELDRITTTLSSINNAKVNFSLAHYELVILAKFNFTTMRRDATSIIRCFVFSSSRFTEPECSKSENAIFCRCGEY